MELIAEIRKAVPELAEFPRYNTDYQLQNWLTHHNGDLKQICSKLREYLPLRRFWNLENYQDTSCLNEISRQRFPSMFYGTEDNDGNVLEVEAWGTVDIQGISMAVCAGDYRN